MSANYEDEPREHPALKNFNRTGEQAKYTLKSAIGGALKGALIGAVALAGLSIVVGGMMGLSIAAIPLIGPFLAPAAVAGGAAGGLAVAAGSLLKGAMWGAGIGAVVSGVRGLLDSGDAADDEAEKRVAAYERREVREERMAMLDQRREQQRLAMAQQAQSMGLAPGVNLPFGPGSNERQV